MVGMIVFRYSFWQGNCLSLSLYDRKVKFLMDGNNENKMCVLFQVGLNLRRMGRKTLPTILIYVRNLQPIGRVCYPPQGLLFYSD